LLSVVLVVVGLICLLLLNTLVNHDSLRVGRLEQQAVALDERAQVLASDVARLQAPASLASRAQALGLVPGGTPAFVRLSDGRVVGTPTRAVAPPPPPAVPPPAARAATKEVVATDPLVEVTAAKGKPKVAAPKQPVDVLQEVPTAKAKRPATRKPADKHAATSTSELQPVTPVALP
jgi:hypothetical protein